MFFWFVNCWTLGGSVTVSAADTVGKWRTAQCIINGEGKMGLKYVQVRFPEGTEGVVISAEVKIDDVKKGSQSWFDARIMTDFVDAEWKKVRGGPNIGGWKGTKDWFSVRRSARVPEGAAGMAVIPCLFNVESGSMSVRNLCVEAQEKYGEQPSYRLEEKGGNGIMYAWHTYHWHKGWARILPVAAKHPIFLGEVGAAPREEMTFIPLEQKEDPYTFSPNMLGFIQKHRINWTGWCFHPKAGPCMIENWDYKSTPYWGEFAKRALAGEQFELTRMK